MRKIHQASITEYDTRVRAFLFDSFFEFIWKKKIVWPFNWDALTVRTILVIIGLRIEFEHYKAIAFHHSQNKRIIVNDEFLLWHRNRILIIRFHLCAFYVDVFHLQIKTLYHFQTHKILSLYASQSTKWKSFLVFIFFADKKQSFSNE